MTKPIAFLNPNEPHYNNTWFLYGLSSIVIIMSLLIGSLLSSEIPTTPQEAALYTLISEKNSTEPSSILTDHTDVLKSATTQTTPAKHIQSFNSAQSDNNHQASSILTEPNQMNQISSAITEPAELNALTTLSTTVKSGESLARIFSRLDLSQADLNALVAASPHKHFFRQLQPGHQLNFTLDKQQVVELAIDQNPLELAVFKRKGRNFEHETVTKIVGNQQKFSAGSIENSLYLAGQKANLNNKVILELAQIFAWDIDFSQDIRTGDAFEVFYNELLLEGDKTVPQKILAARFTNQGKTYTAIEFTDQDGYSRYYSPDGYSMQKTFLRTPVDFARISSHFNLRRRHPILHTIRAHKGVDYAAKIGTPIKATADGKVIFVGRKGGYGKTVILQHRNNITTLYAHLNRYHKRVRKGSRVKQGQIIGEVGKTGLASGPHLHYEFRVAGKHKNPLTVKLPNAKPIEVKDKVAFKRRSQELLAALKSQRQSHFLAQSQPDESELQQSL